MTHNSYSFITLGPLRRKRESKRGGGETETCERNIGKCRIKNLTEFNLTLFQFYRIINT